MTRRATSISVAGVLVLLAGGALVVLSSQAPSNAFLSWAVAAMVATSLLELITGLRLPTRGRVGSMHLFAGAAGLGFSLFGAGLAMTTTQVFAPAPVALLFGLFCVANGLVRSGDVLVSHTAAWPFEALNALISLVLGVVVLSSWAGANAVFVGLVAGVEVLAAGLAMTGSAGTWTSRPAQPTHGRPMHVAPRPL